MLSMINFDSKLIVSPEIQGPEIINTNNYMCSRSDGDIKWSIMGYEYKYRSVMIPGVVFNNYKFYKYSTRKRGQNKLENSGKT